MLRWPALLLAAGLLATCGGGEEQAPAGQQPAPSSAPETATASHELVEAPQLAPLSRSDFERRLEPGAGCDLSNEEGLLLVSVGTGAVARPNGLLRRFEAASRPAPAGAVFTGGGLSIEIIPRRMPGSRIDEVTAWPAEVTVSAPADNARRRFEATWACGA
jgi:hypothetical protein